MRFKIGKAHKASIRTKTELRYVLKEEKIFDMWNQICPIILSKEIISDAKIICKGGTTLNKIYFDDLQRFSEDIDFDMYFKDESSIEEKIDFIDKKVWRHIMGFRYKGHRRGKVIRYACEFENYIGMKENIYLNFNLSGKGNRRSKVTSAHSTIMPLEVSKVPAYPFHILVAKKLKTMYNKVDGKDIYDVYTSLRITDEIDQVIKTLKKILVMDDIAYEEYKTTILEKLENTKYMKNIHGSTTPYIPESLRLPWDVAAKEIVDMIYPHL